MLFKWWESTMACYSEELCQQVHAKHFTDDNKHNTVKSENFPRCTSMLERTALSGKTHAIKI